MKKWFVAAKKAEGVEIDKNTKKTILGTIAEKIKASYDNAGLDTEKKVEFRCLDLGTGKEIL